MGIIKKMLTYGLIVSVGASIGGFTTKCNIERKYELIPKENIERKIENSLQKPSEYIDIIGLDKILEQKNYNTFDKLDNKKTIDNYVK